MSVVTYDPFVDVRKTRLRTPGNLAADSSMPQKRLEFVSDSENVTHTLPSYEIPLSRGVTGIFTLLSNQNRVRFIYVFFFVIKKKSDYT